MLDATWKRGLLSSLNLDALETTHIAALWDGKQLRVYYQASDNFIKEVVSDGIEGAWRSSAVLNIAKPLKRYGTPLAALKFDGLVRVFYGREEGIGQLSYNGEKWTGVFYPPHFSFQIRKLSAVSIYAYLVSHQPISQH